MILARKGEIVTCKNGHEVCDIAEDIDTSKETVIRSAFFGNWRDGKTHGPGPIPRCHVCGGPFLIHTGQIGEVSTLGRRDCFVLHINGQWR